MAAATIFNSIVDMSKITVKDIVQYLNNGGYIEKFKDFEWTDHYDMFFYNGYDTYTKSHSFTLGFQNFENHNLGEESDFYAAHFFVKQLASGTLIAEYASGPCKEFTSFDTMDEWFTEQRDVRMG